VTAGKPIVVVSVGTDHHPFDRLVDWMETWDGADRAEVRMQHGSSRPMRGATNRELLPPDDLVAWMTQASAVVLQGGPGGIWDSLRAGVTPIVVPRVRRLGEAVDDHQVAFAARLEARGLVRIAHSADELVALLAHLEPRTGPTVDLTAALAAEGPGAIRERLREQPSPLSAATRRKRLAFMLTSGGGRR
jgi:UDP-N-acetylglucosamine transferase subunit ALG13